MAEESKQYVEIEIDFSEEELLELIKLADSLDLAPSKAIEKVLSDYLDAQNKEDL